MWVEIVPAVRTPRGQDSFTYSVPNSLAVSRGALVTVPWRRSTVTGIVWQMNRPEPQFATKAVLCDLGMQFSERYLNFLQWFADYYCVSLAHVAKLAIPIQPKRKTRLISGHESAVNVNFNSIQWPEITAAGSQLARQLNQTPTGSHTVLYTQTAQLVSWIRIWVRSANCSTALIVPKEAQVRYWQQWLADSAPLVITGKTNQTASYALWDAIQQSEKGVYIGTKRLSLFPLTELDRIIVIDPEHPAHKQWDLNPRYQVYKVIQAMAKVTRPKHLQVVYCSQAPRFDQYVETQTHLELLAEVSPPQVTLVDMQVREISLAHGMISPAILDELGQADTAFLYYNRKGATRFLLCLHCQTLLPDTRTVTCPACGSQAMAERGIGTQTLQADIQELFPDRPVIELTKDRTTSIPYAEQPIIIGTTYAHTALDWSRIDYIAVVSIDNQLARPQYRSVELAWQELVRLRNYTNHLTVQTTIPVHPVFTALSKPLPADWIRQQLEQRRRWQLPTDGITIQLRNRVTGQERTIHSEADIPADPHWLIDRDE